MQEAVPTGRQPVHLETEKISVLHMQEVAPTGSQSVQLQRVALVVLHMQEAAPTGNQPVHLEKEKADKVRMGAHLALALAYLPIDIPGPQERLSIRPSQDPNAMSDQQDDNAAADDAMYQHTREDLKMQVLFRPIV